MTHFNDNLAFAVAGIVALMVIGGSLPLWLPNHKRILPYALAVAAGVMLSAALTHLVPESFAHLGDAAGVGVLAGFVFLYLFERFVTVHICETMGCHVHTIGISALFGLSIHTFANGVALGAGILQDLGGMVFVAIALHKLPEAFSLTAILLHEGYKRSRIIAMNALFIAMVPLGAYAVRWGSDLIEGPVSSWALAFSAGTFIHIAVSDLLPEVHQNANRRVPVTIAFLLGMAIVWGMQQVMPGHAH